MALLLPVEKAWARATVGEGAIGIRYVVNPEPFADDRRALFERLNQRTNSQPIKLPRTEEAPGPDAAALKVESA